jgi:hypothetical protein
MQTAQTAPQTGAFGIPQPVEIVGVRVPVGSAERRNRVALVEVAFGDLRVVYSGVSLKGRKREVRAPATPERMEGVTLPASLAPLVRDLVHFATHLVWPPFASRLSVCFSGEASSKKKGRRVAPAPLAVAVVVRSRAQRVDLVAPRPGAHRGYCVAEAAEGNGHGEVLPH